MLYKWYKSYSISKVIWKHEAGYFLLFFFIVYTNYGSFSLNSIHKTCIQHANHYISCQIKHFFQNHLTSYKNCFCFIILQTNLKWLAIWTPNYGCKTLLACVCSGVCQSTHACAKIHYIQWVCTHDKPCNYWTGLNQHWTDLNCVMTLLTC